MRLRVAFQGERGAFSEEAATKLLGHEIEVVPRPSFETLFRSVSEGIADFILAPVENSIAGVVQESCELTQRSQLAVCGEVMLPIRLNLIGCSGARFEDIRFVESHPVALAQCKQFFAGNPQLQAVEAEDTAGSVARITTLREVARAAVAGRFAAEMYGGVVLQTNLEDRPDNFTRFVLLGR